MSDHDHEHDHEHDHDHDHDHGHKETPFHHLYAPSPAASVVLDLGGDMGALILEADRSLLGAEIEISPASVSTAVRTHSMVRQRLTTPNPTYDAVYPDLKQGTYTVWRDADTPAGTVTIVGGQISRFRFPGPGSSRRADPRG